MSQNKDQYELCLRADNVNLPATGHFGISGATGGLAGMCSLVHHFGR